MTQRSFLGFSLMLLAMPALTPGIHAQVFSLSKEQLIKFTSQNPYERFPDGRPKVPDAILEKFKAMSSEEILGIIRRGYPNQYVDGFHLLNPGKTMVGRAFTMSFMPLRPDVDDVLQADRKEKGLGRLYNQTGLDMLQNGDVFVCDAFGNMDAGGIIGDNLGYYIWKTTGVGFVIDGAIRDLQGNAEIPMAGYYRGSVPPAITRVMVSGINVPVRIGHATVLPGDIVFGDREGVYFIPPQLAQEVIDEAEITHVHDEWTKKKFDEGKYKSSDIYGSPKDPALIKEYNDYLKSKIGQRAYDDYMKRQQRQQQQTRRQ
jgi:regulator of RNase E activity RraA